MSSEIIRDAREKHEHWFNSFMDSLVDNKGQVDDSLSITHDECEFGKWLNETGLKEYAELEEMHELARVHRELHLHVRNIVERQNVHLKTRLEFGQVEQSRDRLLLLLDKLEQQLQELSQAAP